jgi:hypothetical protein
VEMIRGSGSSALILILSTWMIPHWAQGADRRVGRGGSNARPPAKTAITATTATLKTVAIEGGAAASLGGFSYKTLHNPVVSDDATDRVAFSAVAKDSSTPPATESCVFKVDATGAGTTPACKGDLSPDSRSYKKVGNPSINTGGTATWVGKTGGSFSGVYRGDPTIVGLLGDPVPGANPGLLSGFSLPVIADGGDVVFKGAITGGGEVAGVIIDEGLFRCTGGDGNCSSGTGTLETLVLKNDAVPDRAGREFCEFLAVDASNFGVAFQAATKLDCSKPNLFVDPAGEDPLIGVFRKTFSVGSAVATLALQGETAEPFPVFAGTTYGDSLGKPAINNDGFVAFKSNTEGLVEVGALYVCNPAACPAAPADAVLVAGSVDDGGNVLKNFSHPDISDAEDLAFVAKFPGGSGVYIRRSATSDIETVVLRGDTAPAVVPTATFVRFSPPSMSTGGNVAFQADVKNTTQPKKKRQGIFLFD